MDGIRCIPQAGTPALPCQAALPGQSAGNARVQNVPQGHNVSNRRWSAKRGTGGRRDHQVPSSPKSWTSYCCALAGLPPVPQAVTHIMSLRHLHAGETPALPGTPLHFL